MFRKVEDFLNSWKYESEATLKLFKNLTDESLKVKAFEGGRTIGYLAWHITVSVGEMPNTAGLKMEAPAQDSNEPATASEIAAAYEKVANNIPIIVKQNLTDEKLDEEVEMYGEKWKYGTVLSSLIGHQAHHRGQLTVYMRIAGLKVIGVYGPAKEEWTNYGMPPMK